MPLHFEGSKISPGRTNTPGNLLDVSCTGPQEPQSEASQGGSENSAVHRTVSSGCVPRSGLARSKALHF